MKQAGYDLTINLSSKFRTAFYCRFLKPKFSVAFNHHKHNFWWKRFYHALVEAGPEWNEQHTVLNNFKILAPFNLPDISTTVTMAYAKADINTVDQLAKKAGLKEYIIIQPTARFAFKTWPPASYSQLINYLIARGETVVLTGGASIEDCFLVEQIIKGCNLCNQANRLLNWAGQLALTELAVAIDRAKLFIGSDSAPMHMAAALQTPLVVLFGPTNRKQWHPWQAPHTLIWAGDYRQLPEAHQLDNNTEERYLEAIPVPDVIKVVDGWLTKINSKTLTTR